MQQLASVFVDGIQTLGVHNNVVRLQLMQLQADGKPRPEMQLMIPVVILRQVVDALQKVVR